MFAKNDFSKIAVIFLFFWLCMYSGLTLAQSPKSLIREGLTFYDKGNYADALQSWKSASVVGSKEADFLLGFFCLLYTSPSPRDNRVSRMPSSA